MDVVLWFGFAISVFHSLYFWCISIVKFTDNLQFCKSSAKLFSVVTSVQKLIRWNSFHAKKIADVVLNFAKHVISASFSLKHVIKNHPMSLMKIAISQKSFLTYFFACFLFPHSDLVLKVFVIGTLLGFLKAILVENIFVHCI